LELVVSESQMISPAAIITGADPLGETVGERDGGIAGVNVCAGGIVAVRSGVKVSIGETVGIGVMVDVRVEVLAGEAVEVGVSAPVVMTN
jgi:hypothetical protein